MLIPPNTKIEIHTDNGGLACGRTWGVTQAVQASDGVSLCGDVILRKVGTPDEAGIQIGAHRIARVEFI